MQETLLEEAPSEQRVEVYGPGSELFRWLDTDGEKVPEEVIFEGTAGSGKTHLISLWILSAAYRHPDTKILLIRSTRKSLSDTTLPIFEAVMGHGHPALRTGGTRRNRESYLAPGMAEIVLGSMEYPDRHFGSQYGIVWYEELHEEQSLESWEKLHRACRLDSSLPFNVLVGSMNPTDPGHFSLQRCLAGKALQLTARLWHNPRAFDWQKKLAGAPDEECWTRWGRRYLRRLGKNMTGVTRRRLLLGEWCVAAGAVLENSWDPAKHLIVGRVEYDHEARAWLYVPAWDRPEGPPFRRELVRMVGSQDWGFDNPGVAQVYGLDRDGRAYMLAEVYRKGRNSAWWARTWGKLYRQYPLLEAIACDHDPGAIDQVNAQLRLTQEALGVPYQRMMPSMAREWSKHRGATGEKAGVDELRNRLARRADGTRGLYVLAGNLLGGRDPELYESGRPWNTPMELPGVVYEEYADGRPNKERILKVNDHGFDAMRGACTYMRDRADSEPAPISVVPPDSVNARIPGWVDEYLKDFG